jgi:hypothetical protein
VVVTSSDNDITIDVIIRKLLESIFNEQWESKSPHQKYNSSPFPLRLPTQAVTYLNLEEDTTQGGLLGLDYRSKALH